MAKEVGRLSERVIQLLQSSLEANQPIYLGQSNIEHMMSHHPQDYDLYGAYIPQILASPDYVGINRKDGSLEYVKEFQVGQTFVKVAVRISGEGKLFVRSLYVLNANRVQNFIQKGTLKRV